MLTTLAMDTLLLKQGCLMVGGSAQSMMRWDKCTYMRFGQHGTTKIKCYIVECLRFVASGVSFMKGNLGHLRYNHKRKANKKCAKSGDVLRISDNRNVMTWCLDNRV